MAHVGDAYYTGSVYDSASLAIAVRPILDPNPVASLNVRLTDGANFYTAGITVVSGSGPVNQGSPNLLSSAWPVKPTDGTNIIGVQASPTWITGTVKIENPSAGGGAASNVTAQSGSVTGLLVGGVALSNANPIPITGSVSLANGSNR